MIIVNIEGGFGNQLFSYAFGYSQAQRNHCALWIDTSLQDNGLTRAYELGNLNIQFEKHISYHIGKDIVSRIIANKLCRKFAIGFTTKHVKERKAYVFDSSLLTEKVERNVYYTGNWQNYRYFSEYRDELAEIFQPKCNFSFGYTCYADKVKGFNSVSLHIRRGDYVQIGCTVNEEYYQVAVQKILEKKPTAKFFVFTDDADYSEKLMKTMNIDFEIVAYEKKKPTLEDFYLMSQCNAHIIANSSYSWWAAYLGKKDAMVVAPVMGVWTKDLYPSEWITVETMNNGER